MPALVDMTGKRFGRLVVLGRAEAPGSVKWTCVCDCGKPAEVLGTLLRKGGTRSCGCLAVELARERVTKHRHSPISGKSKTYRCWINMKKRCNNPRSDQYEWYGARGITICDRWVGSFENFLADMGECPEGLTLDRIDSNRGYSPENCRWASMREQAINRRSTVWVEFRGSRMTSKEFAETIGKSRPMVSTLFKKGMTPEQVAAYVPRGRVA